MGLPPQTRLLAPPARRRARLAPLKELSPTESPPHLSFGLKLWTMLQHTIDGLRFTIFPTSSELRPRPPCNHDDTACGPVSVTVRRGGQRIRASFTCDKSKRVRLRTVSITLPLQYQYLASTVISIQKGRSSHRGLLPPSKRRRKRFVAAVSIKYKPSVPCEDTASIYPGKY